MARLKVERTGRYARVASMPDEQVLALAQAIVKTRGSALADLIAGFARTWFDDEREPGLLFGPWSRVPGEKFRVEISVLVRDKDELPDVLFAVAGTDLRMMVAHAIVVLHHMLRQQESRVLADRQLRLAGGETMRFVLTDANRLEAGQNVLDWQFLKVWGREEQDLCTGVLPRPGDSDEPDAEAIVRQVMVTLFSGPRQGETTAQAAFREQFGREILMHTVGTA